MSSLKMGNVRELRPLNPPTAEELAGPQFTRYFHSAERLCNFPPPTGPSIYFYKGTIGQSGAQAVLSNFHLCGFYDQSGLYFNSSEARYQVEKAYFIEKHACRRRYQHKWNTERLPDSLDSTNVRQFVHSQTAPSVQKTATADFWGENFEAEWNERQLEVLLIANRLKYFGCPEERKYLLGTGTRELVKASPSDAHCGIGYSAEKAEENRLKWGNNKHGIALMQVRHELREILADNPSHFDELDRQPYVHRLDYKKPSAAFHEGAFDVPGMPTCQEQHLQAIADIYRRKSSQVGERQWCGSVVGGQHRNDNKGQEDEADQEDDDQEIAAEKLKAKVEAHFTQLYPKLEEDLDVWVAFNNDTADPPFPLEDEFVFMRIAMAFATCGTTQSEQGGPPIDVLKQALEEVRGKEAQTAEATRSYMSWKYGQSSGAARPEIMTWGPWKKTLGAAREQKSFLSPFGFDVVNGSSGLTSEEEDRAISHLQDYFEKQGLERTLPRDRLA
ncbi:hypothetical protein D0868_09533 [Hortaea werneckii]|nr:hypothetical protein D0868_09533 [Hortaea werneckii]RMY39791.1 hypothetical protein D0866_01713 [Hortaea werneckii]